MPRWLMPLGFFCAWLGAEEVFPLQVQHVNPLFSEKASHCLKATAIDNGDDDELVLVAPHGGIYEFSAQLRVGVQIIPLKVHDLLADGLRLKLGNAFSVEQRESMTVVITRSIFK